MKKTLFLIFSIFIIISGNSNGSVASKNNVSSTTGTLNGHDWVDLGLPSGTKWATCNIGATKSEDYGYYYAWGETKSKKKYNGKNYKYNDNPIVLSSKDDVATANWGSGWRMPTRAEMDELSSNCTHKWTTQNGVNGLLFIGTNGNSIFLPAAGYRSGGYNNIGYSGLYWSRSLYSGNSNNAMYLVFSIDHSSSSNSYRYYGFSVRPVCNHR